MANTPFGGTGIIPGASTNVFAELSSVTRRAFVPEVVVQIYKAAPSLMLCLRNAQKAKGGLNQVTIPLQGNPFVNAAWSSYTGNFAIPGVQTALQDAAWNMCLLTTPVSLLGMESVVQSTEAVIPLVRARMADLKTVTIQTLAGAFFGTSAANPLQMNGLLDVYDDGTTTNTYGGIARSATPFWKSNVYSTSLTPSRTTMIARINQLTYLSGGEEPDLIIMSMPDWTTLMIDYMQAESFRTMPGSRYGNDDAINAGFRAVMLGNTAIVGDPFCPTGTAYQINTKYLAMYLSEWANFSMSDWYSQIPNAQLANIAVMITLLNLVCSKPVSGQRLSNIAGPSF